MGRSATWTFVAGALVLLAIGALAGTFAARALPHRADAVPDAAPGWSAIAWPLPFDPWAPGRAFACAASACGQTVTLTVRPKLGFCNCTTGITDDEEIARVGDVEAIGPRFVALAPGRELTIGAMRARVQRFRVDLPNRETRYVLGLVASSRCDVVVATAVGAEPIGAKAEAAALALLNGGPLLGWVEASLGSSP